MTPLVVRYNPVLGLLFALIGLGNVGFTLAASGDGLGLVSGVVFLVLGGLFCFGRAVIVEADRVQVRSVIQTTVRTVAIRGLSDLVLDGTTLRDRRDRDRIADVGWLVARAGDVATLRAALSEAPR